MITFCRKRIPLLYPYELKGQVPQRCDGMHDLSAYRNAKLQFDIHIDQIISKGSKALGFVMRISKCFKQANTFYIIYCTF